MTEKKSAPELRFSKFSSDWYNCQIGECFKERTEKNKTK